MTGVDRPTLIARVRKTLRNEGPIGLAGRLFRKAESAILNVERVAFYDQDLTAVPVSLTPPKIELHCRIASRDDLLNRYRETLAADFGLEADDLKRRLTRSHLALLAVHQDTVVGLVWLAFNGQRVSEIGRNIVLRQGEALTYNGFTLPKWRGCGISPALSLFASHVARQQGAARRINWRRIANEPAMRVSAKLRDRLFALVTTVSVCGVPRVLVFGMNSKELLPLLGPASRTAVRSE